jgi:hypothetical protein
MKSYFDTEEDIEEALSALRDTHCPACGAKGTLLRHDCLWRNGGEANGMRGRRVYCNARAAGRKGCGRTFTLWLSDTLRGRCLGSDALMRFILGLLAGLSTWKAWRGAATGLTLGAGYRTVKWLERSQSALRTSLWGLGPPGLSPQERTPLLETLKILKEALGINAVSAYQKTLQKAFP